MCKSVAIAKPDQTARGLHVPTQPHSGGKLPTDWRRALVHVESDSDNSCKQPTAALDDAGSQS